jgi:hypothetical protein
MVKEHLQPSRLVQLLVSFSTILLAAAGAKAQQYTGTPGSPGTATTIDGKQIPPPPPRFGGVIKDNAKDSTPSWPPRVVPRTGAPNVLLIMTDDQGYGVAGTFGGVIPTAALDRIASAPGNNAPIGGVKVVANSGRFAAWPSGAKNIDKIYAESFRSWQHPDAIIAGAQQIANNVFTSSEGDPQLGVRQ